jgi:N-acetylneuraminate synthase
MAESSQRGTGNGVFVIAEAGVNHNGSLERALKLVEVAASAGADAVKFQTFRAAALATKAAPKAAYQAAATGAGENQFEMLKRLELGIEAHWRLLEHCRQLGIEFMSTAFDEESLDFLVRELGVKRLKSPSGDLTNGPYLLRLARAGLPVVLSTGMTELSEIEDALAVLAYGYVERREPASLEEIRACYHSESGRAALRDRVTILHCTTAYPTPPAAVNLRAMEAISDAFALPVGYSDHTQGTHITVAAVACGACMIEKHFTTDRTLPGPDHQASLEPDELKRMVSEIRDVSAALGDGVKQPAASERENIAIARRSIVAACNIKAGERLAGRLAAKRPAHGISPMQWWTVQGLAANRDYAENELIDVSLLSSGGSA